MRRRELLMAIGAVAMMPPQTGHAQQPPGRVARIGVLMGPARDAQGEELLAAFQQKLRELGWTDGDNARIDLRWGSADIDRIRAHAAQLVASKPDVILCFSARVLKTLQQETRDIPVVFVATNDPVAQGFAASFARPGGNLTGFTLYEFSVAGKLLQLLKEIAPAVRWAAFVFNPENDSARGYSRALESVAPSFGVTLVPTEVRDAADIEHAVTGFAREADGALLLPPDATTRVYRETIIALANRHRMPAIYSNRADVLAGGLMAYGPKLRAQFRGAALYVDRILKGENPAGLPIQAPTEYELFINMNTARALGLTFPQSILARADEAIE
jgi:putative tryptophan/tyrosine transport system substrate-binding protein